MGANEHIRTFNPRCHVFRLNDEAQPRNDNDPRHQTLLLTFRVKFHRHASSSSVVFLRRRFSEPLPLVTTDRHDLTARSKASRMLIRMRVPHCRSGSGIVNRIVSGIRRIASAPEVNSLPALRVQVNVDATVLRLPPPSTLSERERFENGPPILLDGYLSRNYAHYYAASTPPSRTDMDSDSDSDDESEAEFVPASREAIDSLGAVIVASNGDEQCTVCLESMEIGIEATQLPCLHCFHRVCVVTWLEQSRYCPLCRFQLS